MYSNSIGLKSNNVIQLVLLLILLLLLQSCTSGIEVAANLGKKYFIPNNKKSNYSKAVFKIGKKYKIKGKYYFPKKDLYYNKTGIASWYGPKFHGKITANGEVYDQYALTAAHRTLPLPSAVKVTNLQNNKSIILRINDRGPYVKGRILDCSYGAAKKLDFIQQGTTEVKIEVIEWGDGKYMQHRTISK